MVSWKVLSTMFTLSGTIIGAGVLGLPYVFAQSGFIIGIFWLFVLGGIVLYTLLCLGEISLRTKGDHHQLVGYAEKYLGKWGARVMLLAVLFGIYSALLAYLIGEGQSLSMLFTGELKYSIYFGIGFWLLMSFLLGEGLRELRRVEVFGVIAIIAIIIGLFVWNFGLIESSNLGYVVYESFFIPFGVVLFALMGFTAVPELRREIKGNEKYLKRSIILGFLIPFILYIIFAIVVVGVLGRNVSEVATLDFGWPLLLLGVFTMLTSYFVLSFALKDLFYFDMKMSKKTDFLLVGILPLLLYFLVSFLELGGFVLVLGVGGVISGGLMGILILVMNYRAKKIGLRIPEYKVFNNWFIVALLSLVFIFGIMVELV